MPKEIKETENSVEETTEEQTKYSIPEYAEANLKKIKNNDAKLRYKITIARKMFKDCNVTKSGKNAFQHFDYFELKDITPHSTEIELQLMLTSVFQVKRNKGVLTVYDNESDESDSKVVFYKDRPEVKSGGNFNQQVQGIGSESTYLKRYCYLDYLNIVEPDTIDSLDNGKKPIQKPIQKNKTVTRKVTPKKTLQKKQLKQIKTVDDCKNYIFENLTDKNDLKGASDLLKKLKMNQQITQDIFNEMSEIIEGATR